MKKKQKIQTKVASIFGEVLLWILAIFCISVSLVSTIDAHTNYSCSYLGLRTSVIVSNSMANANPENTYLNETMTRIDKYDVITAREVSYEEINLYDVVLHLEGSNLICHRVIDKYEDNGISYLVTRGDSNNMDDAPFAYSLCRGKVVNVIPKVGEVLLFIRSGYFLVALFFSIFLVSSVLFLISHLSEKMKTKAIKAANKADAIDVEPNKEETVEEKNE